MSLEVPEREQKEGLAIKIIQKELMNGNIPNWAKHLNIKIQGSWANSRKNLKKSTFVDLSADFNATSSGYLLFADVVTGKTTITEFESRVKSDNIDAFLELYGAVYARMMAA